MWLCHSNEVACSPKIEKKYVWFTYYLRRSPHPSIKGNIFSELKLCHVLSPNDLNPKLIWPTSNLFKSFIFNLSHWNICTFPIYMLETSQFHFLHLIRTHSHHISSSFIPNFISLGMPHISLNILMSSTLFFWIWELDWQTLYSINSWSNYHSVKFAIYILKANSYYTKYEPPFSSNPPRYIVAFSSISLSWITNPSYSIILRFLSQRFTPMKHNTTMLELAYHKWLLFEFYSYTKSKFLFL